jgi:putative tricarboxylic transport membrane protein
MDALVAFAQGLAVAAQPLHLGVMIAGVLVGVIAGALPGISFVNAMAIALPFTYMMSPLVAMISWRDLRRRRVRVVRRCC